MERVFFFIKCRYFLVENCLPVVFIPKDGRLLAKNILSYKIMILKLRVLHNTACLQSVFGKKATHFSTLMHFNDDE